MTARAMCANCARPVAVCWCAHLPRIQTSTPVLVLQHPREERVAIGTARMASPCLPNATLVVGVEVDDEPSVVSALGDPDRPAILLWPGPDARDLTLDPPRGPVTLVVVDGTWALAKKLVRVNPRIGALPRYALAPSGPSEYRIRREPRAECLSTIEAIQLALGVLEGDASRFRPMLAPFRAMIDAQIHHEEVLRGNRHHRTPRHARPPRLPAALTDGRRIVVVGGEANAWPFKRDRAAGRPSPRHPDELIHWLAVRADTGERFDQLVAPSHPLSPSTPDHTALAASDILGAMPGAQFLDAWNEFVRPDDVVCGWGHYAANRFRERGGVLPKTYLDLRSITTAWLREKPGTIEACAARFGTLEDPLGRGRGGARLAMAHQILQHLLAHTP